MRMPPSGGVRAASSSSATGTTAATATTTFDPKSPSARALRRRLRSGAVFGPTTSNDGATTVVGADDKPEEQDDVDCERGTSSSAKDDIVDHGILSPRRDPHANGGEAAGSNNHHHRGGGIGASSSPLKERDVSGFVTALKKKQQKHNKRGGGNAASHSRRRQQQQKDDDNGDDVEKGTAAAVVVASSDDDDDEDEDEDRENRFLRSGNEGRGNDVAADGTNKSDKIALGGVKTVPGVSSPRAMTPRAMSSPRSMSSPRAVKATTRAMSSPRNNEGHIRERRLKQRRLSTSKPLSSSSPATAAHPSASATKNAIFKTGKSPKPSVVDGMIERSKRREDSIKDLSSSSPSSSSKVLVLTEDHRLGPDRPISMSPTKRPTNAPGTAGADRGPTSWKSRREKSSVTEASDGTVQGKADKGATVVDEKEMEDSSKAAAASASESSIKESKRDEADADADHSNRPAVENGDDNGDGAAGSDKDENMSKEGGQPTAYPTTSQQTVKSGGDSHKNENSIQDESSSDSNVGGSKEYNDSTEGQCGAGGCPTTISDPSSLDFASKRRAFNLKIGKRRFKKVAPPPPQQPSPGGRRDMDGAVAEDREEDRDVVPPAGKEVTSSDLADESGEKEEEADASSPSAKRTDEDVANNDQEDGGDRTTISKEANNKNEHVYASRRNWAYKRSTVGGRATIVSSVKTPPSPLANEPAITATKANDGDAAKNEGHDGVVREEEDARVQDNEDDGPKITRDGDKDNDDDKDKNNEDDNNAGHQDFTSRRNWASNLGRRFAVAASGAPPPPSRTGRVFVARKKEKDGGEEVLTTAARKKDNDTAAVASPPPPPSPADTSHDDDDEKAEVDDAETQKNDSSMDNKNATTSAADRETELAKRLLAKRRKLFEQRKQQLPANNDDHEEEDDIRAEEHVRIDGFEIPKKSEISSLGSDSLTAKTLKISSPFENKGGEIGNSVNNNAKRDDINAFADSIMPDFALSMTVEIPTPKHSNNTNNTMTDTTPGGGTPSNKKKNFLAPHLILQEKRVLSMEKKRNSYTGVTFEEKTEDPTTQPAERYLSEDNMFTELKPQWTTAAVAPTSRENEFGSAPNEEPKEEEEEKEEDMSTFASSAFGSDVFGEDEKALLERHVQDNGDGDADEAGNSSEERNVPPRTPPFDWLAGDQDFGKGHSGFDDVVHRSGEILRGGEDVRKEGVESPEHVEEEVEENDGGSKCMTDDVFANDRTSIESFREGLTDEQQTAYSAIIAGYNSKVLSLEEGNKSKTREIDFLKGELMGQHNQIKALLAEGQQEDRLGSKVLSPVVELEEVSEDGTGGPTDAVVVALREEIADLRTMLDASEATAARLHSERKIKNGGGKKSPMKMSFSFRKGAKSKIRGRVSIT